MAVAAIPSGIPRDWAKLNMAKPSAKVSAAFTLSAMPSPKINITIKQKPTAITIAKIAIILELWGVVFFIN